MRAIRITKQNLRTSVKCVECKQLPQVGQIVLIHEVPDAAWAYQRIMFHVACMEALVAKLEGVSTEYDQLRARILATGEAFPASVG